MTTLCDRIRAGLARGRVVRGVTPYTTTAFDRSSIVVDEEPSGALVRAGAPALTQDRALIGSVPGQAGVEVR
jgi:hypothetical protein